MLHRDSALNVPCRDASPRYVNYVRFVALRRRPHFRVQMLVFALLHPRVDLDYGNGMLVGLPAYLTHRLQSVLNVAAQAVA